MKNLLRTNATSLVVGLIGFFGVFTVYEFSRWQLDSNWKTFVEKSQSSVANHAEQVGFKLNLIASNLRTISQLPGVRDIDRHGENLDGNSKSAIQQVYNNLALQIDVSEVYIVPGEFKPDRLDPKTGKFEEPALMFDELIVGAGRFADLHDPFGAASELESHSVSIPEVEGEEYQELVRQIAVLKQTQPNFEVKILRNLPFYSSAEVITCDNTDFAKSGLDDDRKGLLFSVPYYRSSGAFGGVVSAIIRSNAIRAMVPSGSFQIKSPNKIFGNQALEMADGNLQVWTPSVTGLGNAKFFMVASSLGKFDSHGDWKLQSVISSNDFYKSPEFSLVRKTFFVSVAAILGLIGFCFTWGFAARKRIASVKHRASHDLLTELPNRFFLEEKLQAAFLQTKRGDSTFIFYLDLDRFKAVNDTYGHNVGDAVIKEAAARIRRSIRSSDIVARIGGDEFVVLLTGAGNSSTAVTSLAESVISAFVDVMQIDGRLIDVGVSIGIASIEVNANNAHEVIRQADLALFNAKTDGRGCYRFFNQAMEDEHLRRQTLTTDLKKALENDDFELHYQLVVDAKTSRPNGCEALLRWTHPALGPISPMEFIPLAEEAGLIHRIGQWVLKQACFDALKFPQHFQIAVNVSPLQLQNSSFPLHVVNALNLSGLNPSRLELEFTESVLLTDSTQIQDVIKQLRQCGVQIALDDFGVGFSSLGYLTDFEFDRIKLDRSFMRQIGNERDEAVLKAVVGIGNSLGIAVTAEGVETEVQLNAVRAQGCTDVQGYFFSKPKKLSLLLKEINSPALETRA